MFVSAEADFTDVARATATAKESNFEPVRVSKPHAYR